MTEGDLERMQISVMRIGNESVIRLEGEVDMSTSRRLRETLLDAVKEQPNSRIVVSMEHVNYIDSSGIASLVEGLQSARRAGVRLVLAGLNEGPRHVLQLTRIIDVFEVYPSEADALSA